MDKTNNELTGIKHKKGSIHTLHHNPIMNLAILMVREI